MSGTRNIKDSLFVALFNHEDAARELYNAIMQPFVIDFESEDHSKLTEKELRDLKNLGKENWVTLQYFSPNHFSKSTSRQAVSFTSIPPAFTRKSTSTSNNGALMRKKKKTHPLRATKWKVLYWMP
jgi:hypothetical protein